MLFGISSVLYVHGKHQEPKTAVAMIGTHSQRIKHMSGTDSAIYLFFIFSGCSDRWIYLPSGLRRGLLMSRLATPGFSARTMPPAPWSRLIVPGRSRAWTGAWSVARNRIKKGASAHARVNRKRTPPPLQGIEGGGGARISAHFLFIIQGVHGVGYYTEP